MHVVLTVPRMLSNAQRWMMDHTDRSGKRYLGCKWRLIAGPLPAARPDGGSSGSALSAAGASAVTDRPSSDEQAPDLEEPGTEEPVRSEREIARELRLRPAAPRVTRLSR